MHVFFKLYLWINCVLSPYPSSNGTWAPISHVETTPHQSPRGSVDLSNNKPQPTKDTCDCSSPELNPSKNTFHTASHQWSHWCELKNSGSGWVILFSHNSTGRRFQKYADSETRPWNHKHKGFICNEATGPIGSEIEQNYMFITTPGSVFTALRCFIPLSFIETDNF